MRYIIYIKTTVLNIVLNHTVEKKSDCKIVVPKTILRSKMQDGDK